MTKRLNTKQNKKSAFSSSIVREDMAALRPNCSFSSQTVRCPESISLHSVQTPSTARICNRGTRRRRRRELLSVILLGAGLPSLIHVDSSVSFASDERPLFYDLEDSNDGVKALDIREGSGRSPRPGDKVNTLNHLIWVRVLDLRGIGLYIM